MYSASVRTSQMTASSDPMAALSFSTSDSMARLGGCGVNVTPPPATREGPDSTARPSAVHFVQPPFSTRTFVCP